MAGSILVLLAILGGAVFMAAALKRRVAEMIPLSVVFLIVHTYLCGLIGLLRFSVYVTVFAMILLGVAGLVLSFVKRDRWRPAWDLSPVLFVLGFVWIVYVGMGRIPLEQTDFTQWALAPKAMYYANSLTPAGGVLSYAPAMAVFQTVFQVCNSLFASGGGFTDWLLYAAYGTACLALLLPLIIGNHPKRWVRTGYTLLFFLAVVCVPLQFFNLFSTLNPDGFLAILAAACFLQATRTKSPVQAVITGLYLFALTLAKDAGLYFALCVLPLYFITLLRSDVYKQAARVWRITMLAVPPAFILLARLTWPHLSFPLHAAEGAAETLGLYWQQFTAKLITVKAGLTLNGSTVFTLAAAYVSDLALTIALAVITAMLLRAAKARKSLRDTGTTLWFAPAVTALYAAGLYLAYLFAVDPADTAKLAGFQRLLGAGLVFWLLVVIDSALCMLAGSPQWTWRRHTLVILLCLCVILSGSGALDDLTCRGFTAANDQYHAYYAVADAAQDVVPEDAAVYIVSQNDDGTAFDTLRYALCPRRTNTGVTYWLRDPGEKQYDWTYPVTPAQWQAGLAAYDYVLVYRADDYLQTAVAEAVAADGGIKAHTIYRIDPDTGLLTIAAGVE